MAWRRGCVGRPLGAPGGHRIPAATRKPTRLERPRSRPGSGSRRQPRRPGLTHNPKQGPRRASEATGKCRKMPAIRQKPRRDRRRAVLLESRARRPSVDHRRRDSAASRSPRTTAWASRCVVFRSGRIVLRSPISLIPSRASFRSPRRGATRGRAGASRSGADRYSGCDDRSLSSSAICCSG
jgi:hypothetical protein